MVTPKPNLLAETLSSCKYAFWGIGLFSFFINLLMLVVPLYMLQIYGRVLTSYSIETLIFLTLITVLALGIFGALDIFRYQIALEISSWLDKRLSPAALGHSADEILQGRSYGGQSLRDIAALRAFLTSIGLFALFDVPWIPIYILVIFLMDPILGSIALISGIVLFLLAVFNEFATHTYLTEANKEKIATQTYVDSALRNAEVIQAMGMMSNIVKTWEIKNTRGLTSQDAASKRSGYFITAAKFFRLLSQVMVLGVGAYLVIKDNMAPGIMIAASIIMSRALAPVEQSISVWKQLIGCSQAYTRLKQHFTNRVIRDTDIQLPTPKGQLTLEELLYIAPEGKKPIIQGISLNISAGSLVAIIGPSGSGKSTLARLMVGAWMPTRGKVRLDGADVYTWAREDFGQHVGYLPQDVELFYGTVKENIARLGEVDDKAVIEAAKMAGVHQMILHLPNAYLTHIDPAQQTLSGGQRQLIALARTLYKSPKVIVLDEPDANLDKNGEIALASALTKMKEQSSTQIVITHKASLLQLVDYIIVMKEGMVPFAGARDEVLTKLRDMTRQG